MSMLSALLEEETQAQARAQEKLSVLRLEIDQAIWYAVVRSQRGHSHGNALGTVRLLTTDKDRAHRYVALASRLSQPEWRFCHESVNS
jgi:hypothetical protein